jgi:hypothetical protein
MKRLSETPAMTIGNVPSASSHGSRPCGERGARSIARGRSTNRSRAK